MKNPETFDKYLLAVKEIVLELGCEIVSETLEECNTLLEESGKRRLNWYVKDRGEKSLLTSLGTISFTRTRFENKKTKETAYLLDRMLGLKPHMRISQEAQVCLLEEAVKSSYEKAGQEISVTDCVTRQTVMKHIHQTNIPQEKRKDLPKKEVNYLYVEADEDHIRLQYLQKKGDVRRWKGYGNNSRIAKLVYVHEGIIEEGKRRRLKNVHYFGGFEATEDGNEKLWNEVKQYIEQTYDEEKIKKIYFQSDGGSWMKKGIERIGAEFVLDEFHLKEYIKRIARNGKEERSQQEVEEEMWNWMKKGKKKEWKEWSQKQIEKQADDRKQKKLKKDMEYIEKNWKGIRKRIKKEEGTIGSSTESHISHVLSSRMSTRPMGWSLIGANKISKLRIYWKNERNFKELLKEETEEKKKEEYLTLTQIRSWEIRNRKENGKYIERLQASVSRSIGAKMYFQEAIAGIC